MNIVKLYRADGTPFDRVKVTQSRYSIWEGNPANRHPTIREVRITAARKGVFQRKPGQARTPTWRWPDEVLF